MSKIHVQLKDKGTIFHDASQGATVLGENIVEVTNNVKVAKALKSGVLVEVKAPKSEAKSKEADEKKAEDKAKKDQEEKDKAAKLKAEEENKSKEAEGKQESDQKDKS